MDTPLPTRTLVVDDDAGIRRLICAVIRLAENGVEITGEATTADEAISRWRHDRPDVVVLDYRIPGRDGLVVAEEILAERPGQSVILFSASLDDDMLRRATRIGVRACLSKEQVDELPELILAFGRAA